MQPHHANLHAVFSAIAHLGVHLTLLQHCRDTPTLTETLCVTIQDASA